MFTKIALVCATLFGYTGAVSGCNHTGATFMAITDGWACVYEFNYTGTRAATGDCGAGATSTTIAAGWACICNAGYDGTLKPMSCDPVKCPSGSHGFDVPSGCSCDAGRNGSIIAKLGHPWFVGECDPVKCPSGSSGVDVPSGCACDAGYRGWVVSTTRYPFFKGECVKITATDTMEHPEDHQMMEKSIPNPCGSGNISFYVITNGWACLPGAGYTGTLSYACSSGSIETTLTDGWACVCKTGYENQKPGECVKITATDTIEDEHQPEVKQPEDQMIEKPEDKMECGFTHATLYAITNGWACMYKAGYTGVKTGGCGYAHATFHNITGGWACVCNAGYDGTLKPMQCVKITAMEYAEETSEDQQKEDEAAEDANTIMISVAVGGLLTGAVAASAFVLKRRHATGRSEPLLEK